MDLSSSLKFVHGVCHFVFFCFSMVFAFLGDWPKPRENKKKQNGRHHGDLSSSLKAVHGVCHFVFLFFDGVLVLGHSHMRRCRKARVSTICAPPPPLIPPFWKQNMEPTHWRLSVVIRSILRIQVWPIMIHVLCLRCWKQDGREVLRTAQAQALSLLAAILGIHRESTLHLRSSGIARCGSYAVHVEFSYFRCSIHTSLFSRPHSIPRRHSTRKTAALGSMGRPKASCRSWSNLSKAMPW